MRTLAAAALALAVVVPLAASSVIDAPTAAAATPTTSAQAVQTLTGADISWPQCPKGIGIPSRPTEGKPMPKASTTFVIVGLTNGPGFTPNPCLAKHVAWVRLITSTPPRTRSPRSRPQPS